MTQIRDMTNQLKTPNHVLWAVKSYIDLVNVDKLNYGNGIKALYVLTHGVGTFDPTDIKGIVCKAENMGLIPHALGGFMNLSIGRNCANYALLLQDIISARLIGISNGDIVAPKGRVYGNTLKSRQAYYSPPANWLNRVSAAINSDFIATNRNLPRSGEPYLVDCANEADLLMFRYSGSEGSLYPAAPAWGALSAVVRGLVGRINEECCCSTRDYDYKTHSLAALRCLWFIAKLLTGDLSAAPAQYQINTLGGTAGIPMSDGTLASIPLPVRQTINVFYDDNICGGLSMKGRMYLSAASAASFYRNTIIEDF